MSPFGRMHGAGSVGALLYAFALWSAGAPAQLAPPAAEQTSGTLWMAASDGIRRLDPRDLTPVLEIRGAGGRAVAADDARGLVWSYGSPRGLVRHGPEGARYRSPVPIVDRCMRLWADPEAPDLSNAVEAGDSGRVHLAVDTRDGTVDPGADVLVGD